MKPRIIFFRFLMKKALIIDTGQVICVRAHTICAREQPKATSSKLKAIGCSYQIGQLYEFGNAELLRTAGGELRVKR